ncbi:phage tail assembly chaperone [Pseudomonas tohonis]|uniref:phage tail assembly chaperone n=1 Tax=Pseudomonas tohonis TaxID=2725477 RepID=UPI001F33F344|nr:hypothetical protein [Pseudomonas tohonis]
MTEFELAGKNFRIGRMPAMQQFHLSRKVAPIIPTLIPVFLKLQAGNQQDGGDTPLSGDLGGTAALLGPFADAIADMPNDAAEFVLSTTLAVVQLKQGTNWVPIWSEQHKTTMFDDLDLGVLIQLSVRVMVVSLGPTLAGLLSGQSRPATV